MRCRLLAHHRSPPRLTAHHRASPHQRAPSCTMQAKEDGAGSATATPQDDKTDKRPHETWLYMDVADSLMPIIYTSNYNITFMGLEKMHPFDAGKWGKVVQFLKEAKMITDDMLVKPREAEEKDLLVAHTQRYLNSLKWSITVARITEVPFVAALPNVLVRQKVLKPFLLQTGGTVLAGKLAMERGWAVNVGGGFHHCSGDSGGGFCAYADITLCIKFLFERVDAVSKAMIVDLDAHQAASAVAWSSTTARRTPSTCRRCAWRWSARYENSPPTLSSTMLAPTCWRETAWALSPSRRRESSSAIS